MTPAIARPRVMIAMTVQRRPIQYDTLHICLSKVNSPFVDFQGNRSTWMRKLYTSSGLGGMVGEIPDYAQNPFAGLEHGLV